MYEEKNILARRIILFLMLGIILGMILPYVFESLFCVLSGDDFSIAMQLGGNKATSLMGNFVRPFKYMKRHYLTWGGQFA